MNCKEISQAVKKINDKFMVMKDLIPSADSENIFLLENKFKDLAQEIGEVLTSFEIRLSKEQLQETQSFYDWLGLDVDIKKEYEKENILLPTNGLLKLAAKSGYTELIIVPPQELRQEVFEKVKKKIIETDPGVAGLERISEGISNDSASFKSEIHILKEADKRCVAILVNPDGMGVSNETFNKTPAELARKISKTDVAAEKLGLSGFSLHDFLIFHTALAHKRNYNPDGDLFTYLLQEKDANGDYLFGCFQNFWHQIEINSWSEHDRDKDVGARFCIYPEKAFEEESH